METWRKVWRDGVAPQFSVRQLEVLRVALETDDARLIQGATTQPPPLLCAQDWSCEGGCLVSYPFAFEDGNAAHPKKPWDGVDGEVLVSTKTVGEVEHWFSNTCWGADTSIGEQGSIRHLLNWYDEAPRDVMRRELLAEVAMSLSQRAAAVA